MRGARRLTIALSTALFLVLCAVPALAAPRVTIVVRKVHDSLMEQFETQLRAELLTMGFEVLTLPEPPATVDPDSLEAIAERTQAIAAIIIDQPEGNVSGRLWITERVTGKTLFRKVRPEKVSPDAPTIFALRAVELLRASLLELQEPHPTRGTVEATPQLKKMVAPPAPTPQPATPAPSATAQKPAPVPAPPPVAVQKPEPRAPGRAARWSASAGIRVHGGPGGMPWAVGPTVGVAWHPAPGWAIQLQGSGPFSARVESGGEGALTNQETAELRVRADLLRRPGIAVPYLAAGIGAHRMGATGTAPAPSMGLSNSAWTPTASMAAGMRLRAARNVSLVVEAQTAFTASRQKVVFGDRAVATAGRPLMAGTIAGEVSW